MQKMYVCPAGRLNSFIKLMMVLQAIGFGGKGWAQVVSWTSAGAATAWYTSANWNPNTTAAAWLTTNIAQFNNTGSATSSGINMGTRALSIGAIELTSLRARDLTIGNSSGTSSPLTLNGATVNSIGNTILTNSSTNLLSLQNNDVGTGNIMGIVLGNVTNNIINTDGTGDITIGCIISGAYPLTKSGKGSGVLNLSTGNTHSGKTTINSTFINASAESAFGANPGFFIADQITMNGGGIQATSGDITFLSNRGISIGATGGTFDVATTKTITASSIIMGSGPLNITGSGTGLVLMTGQHTYIGTTTISSGTLQLNRTGGNTIPVTNNVVINGGTLNINTSQTLNNLDINSGNLNIAAGVTLTINGTLTFNGGTINTTGMIAYGSLGKLIYNSSKTTGIEWSNSNLPTAVTLNNAAVVTLANNASTSGNLTINNTARLVGTAFTLSVSGDWNSTSTNGSTGAGYTGGTGTPANSSIVILNGSGIKSINHAGGAIFRNLNISGTAYYTSNNNIDVSVNTLNISNGTLDMLTNTLDGSGNLTMTNGFLKLAKLNSTLPELAGIYSITGGTIELNGAGTQELLGSKSYANLTFSNSGTKTLSSSITGLNTINGTVLISGSVILNVANRTFGGTGTNLTMTGTSKYLTTGGGTNPDVRGIYLLASTTTIEFGGTSATEIYLAPTYANVDISGSNVSLSSTSSVLNMQAATTFTVKTGGIFKVKATNGFSGSTITAVGNTNNPLITLEANSTINYEGGIQTITNQLPYQNIILSGIGLKTAPSTNLLIEGNLSRASTSTFNANAGRVVFQGSTAQTFTDVTGLASIEFYNLSNTNTTNLIVNNSFAIQNELNLTPVAKLNLNTGDIILRSTINRTAYVTNLGTTTPSTLITYNSGRFEVERYLYAQKSWRFLSVPLLKLADDATSPSINNSWREGGTALLANSYGTRITGPGPIGLPGGVDENTQRGSMKYYDDVTNNYIEIKSSDLLANKTIANDEGYYVFVRGDRGISVPNVATGLTTLRARGKIRTGNQTYSVGADKFQSVGNPFPSRLQFLNITKTGGTVDAFIIWNPLNSGGGYGVGRFEQYSNISGNYQGAFGTRNFIESGEAFFISAIAANGSLIIKEGDKTSGSANVSRVGVTIPTLEINLFATANDNTEYKADLILLNFDHLFSNSINNEDVKKFSNASNNVSILNGTTKLFVERRNNLTITDTIFLSLTNTRIAPYRFEIDPSVLGNLPLNAFLKDKFLGTETQVSLTNVTNVNFTITNDAASRVADRFMIVFKQAIPIGQLTGNFINIAVNKSTDKTNKLEWRYSNELNISQYSIELSKDGIAFKGIGNQNAGNISTTKLYIFIDIPTGSGTYYYRVKAISTTGQIQYSDIVKINEDDTKPVFTINPNPVENKMLRLSFKNFMGNYSLKLVSKKGVPVYNTQLSVTSTMQVKNVIIGNAVASGLYDVILIDKSGNNFVQTVYLN